MFAEVRRDIHTGHISIFIPAAHVLVSISVLGSEVAVHASRTDVLWTGAYASRRMPFETRLRLTTDILGRLNVPDHILSFVTRVANEREDAGREFMELYQEALREDTEDVFSGLPARFPDDEIAPEEEGRVGREVQSLLAPFMSAP